MLANKRDFTSNGNKVNLAKRIKEIRKAKGLSQKKLAGKLEVARNTVGNWEKEVCMPSIDKIIAIADVLEISLDVLLGRESQSKETQSEATKSKEEDVPEKKYVEKLVEIEKKIQEFTELIQSEKKRMQENA